MTKGFKLEQLITIAKRENNTKRSYLYVNPLQGKHIPVSPSQSLELFSQLAEKVEKRYPGERLLIVGFAETATAIGAAIAYRAQNCRCYLNTTREHIPGGEYLYFTESHSHATEQRLAVNGLEACLKQVDRVVFAEDEVTTGNTIEKLIRILQKSYPGVSLGFGIVSILNSMSISRLEQLQQEGIVCDYLHHIPTEYRVEEIHRHSYLPLEKQPKSRVSAPIQELRIGNYWNCRVVCEVCAMRERVDAFVQKVMEAVRIPEEERELLILGTEEFMFPGMCIGKAIEEAYPGKLVRFHATTRSPIEISGDEDYPLHNRTPLNSLYGDERKTFLYNLRKYDRVLLVTDAAPIHEAGLTSIRAALEAYGNEKITMISWGEA